MGSLGRGVAKVVTLSVGCGLAGLCLAQGVAPTTQPAGEKGGDLHPRVRMETSLGTMVLELDAEKAPVTVANFLKYADEGFYAGTIFHRVIKTFMIQGGGFAKDLQQKKTGEPIKNEWRNGLKNLRGTIAMARVGGNADSATSQFFINVVDNSFLDQPQPDGAAYCVFGKVVEGMEVVDKIRDTAVRMEPRVGREPAFPVETVEIIKVERMR